ncbi:MAG: sigma-70 family RNA polymerase sigma factor [bacterium]|nr:sigma-70 family RNA polymerase sigma factor [bacterium]
MSRKRDRFTEAHKTYYPLVFSAVQTKVDDVDDSKDICQDVFIKFYEKFDEIENHRKWLYGALRLSVLEFYRKRKDTVDIDDLFADVSLTFVNGFREARIVIAEAIEKMDNFDNDHERALFDLVAVHNYSYSETGRELGLSKRQVEYKYRRIVDRVIDYLDKQGIQNLEDLL